ncbi:hypothetical protein [Streptomyces sp. NPDC002644]
MTTTQRKSKVRKNQPVGFGIQRGLSLEDGAILFLRITEPRRLRTQTLGEVLMHYFKGGYETLILDQGNGMVKKLNLLDFLGMLQAAYTTGRLLMAEKLLRRGYGR